MPNIEIDDTTLKRAIKDAISETLVERRELVVELFREALEDFGLARAIEEGLEEPGFVPKSDILAILEAPD